jgi:hypothetical protein
MLMNAKNDVSILRLHGLSEGYQQFRILFQIRVYEKDTIALRMRKTCQYRGVMPKIPREFDDPDSLIFGDMF